MLSFSVLASGSRANSIYVTDGCARVLIDCGLSARETARRLTALGVEPASIDAIVISHEHSDHVKGVRVFSKQYCSQVYANHDTFAVSTHLNEIEQERQVPFSSGDILQFGGLEIKSFSVVHDAIDPLGFRVRCGSLSLGVITDLGQVTALVEQELDGVDALVLESNHDPELLENAPYAWPLKQRIRSRTGHLSNNAAGQLLQSLFAKRSQTIRHVVAAHISENSNTPEKAIEVLTESVRGMGLSDSLEIVAACARESTRLIKVGG